MSIGHSFAGGENGNAVSGGRKRSEGLRGRKARKIAGRGRPAVDAKSRVHAFVAIFASLELQLRLCPYWTA